MVFVLTEVHFDREYVVGAFADKAEAVAAFLEEPGREQGPGCFVEGWVLTSWDNREERKSLYIHEADKSKVVYYPDYAYHTTNFQVVDPMTFEW